MLVLRRDGEERQQDAPDEDVVDAQALLDDESREVLRTSVCAIDTPHDESEGDAQRDPHHGLDGCTADRRLVVLLVENRDVDGDEGDEPTEQDCPVPPRDIEHGVLGICQDHWRCA